MTTSKAFVELVDGFTKPPPAIGSKGHAMTTLEEFVRDGVVKDCPNDRGVQSLRIDAGYGFVLLEGNELLVQDPTSDGAVVNMTPTQLRALSAMALWAAEQKEKKQ